MARQEDEMRAKEEEYEKTKKELEKITKIKKELEEQNVTLLQAKNDIYLQLQAEQVSYTANTTVNLCWSYGNTISVMQWLFFVLILDTIYNFFVSRCAQKE